MRHRTLQGGVGIGIVALLFLLTGNGAAAASDADTVSITFRVVVPEETPPGDRIYWSGTLNRWDPGPEGVGWHPWPEEEGLDREAGEWVVTLDAPRGDTIRYRYTRGSVFSVEGRAGGGERPPRQVVASEATVIMDTVAAWRDIPNPMKADSWFKVALDPVGASKLEREGEPAGWTGGVLYATDRFQEIFGRRRVDDAVQYLPAGVVDTALYVSRLSRAPKRNAVRVLAGRTSSDAPWRIYLDRANDGHFSAGDRLFEIPHGATDRISKRSSVVYNRVIDGAVRVDTSRVEVRWAPDAPARYASSHRDVPKLVLSVPFAVREGTIELPDTTLTLALRYRQQGHALGWRSYHDVLVDHNGDGLYDWSPGSGEYYEFQEPFQLGYLDLEVADVDPHGRWVRLRPAADPVADRSMRPGDPAPAWDAPLFDDVPLDAARLRGRYVLLDFWSTWCAPCIEELPTLRAAYERFAEAPFVLMGVVYNDRRANVERMAEERGVEWPQIYDQDGAIRDRFQVHGIPDPVLIGPGGTILERGSALRGEDLLETLATYLE